MQTLIFGSRSLNPSVTQINYAAELLAPTTRVLSGTAKGVDRAGEAWASANRVPVDRIPANWSTGRGAGMERNSRLVERAEQAICFWDGVSRGTADTLRKVRDKGIPLVLVKVIDTVTTERI
jgi:SLOG family YspA-like protein